MRSACDWKQSFQKSLNGVRRWSGHVSTTAPRALKSQLVHATQVQHQESAVAIIEVFSDGWTLGELAGKDI